MIRGVGVVEEIIKASRRGTMRSQQGFLLLLLSLAVAASVSVQSDSLAGIQYPETMYGHETEERSWIGSRRKKSGEGDGGEAAAAAVPRDEYQNGDWSVGGEEGRDVYNGNDALWAMQVAASESELRNVYSGDRVRWMPTRSRFRPARRPEMDEEELPLQEHQLRQQQRKGRPGFRPGTQLENLGGGMLVDNEEDEDDEEEEPYPPPPRKRPVQRRPQDSNGGKPSPISDLKSILKSSGPSSLSEVLQQKNLSLEDFLKGSRNALSAITSVSSEVEKPQQRRRRPVFSAPATRPTLIRKRPSAPTTTAVAPKIPERTTTHPTEDERKNPASEAAPRPTLKHPSTGDPSRDILEIIWQDGDGGPSLAEVLSSRNMTVEDLLRQRQRASGREDITTLFGEAEKEAWEEEDQKEAEGRNVASFDLLETDWEQDQYAEEPEERAPGEEDQEVTQSRNTYHVVVTSPHGTVAPHEAVTRIFPPQEPLPEITRYVHGPAVQQPVTEAARLHEPSTTENPPKSDDHSPAVVTQAEETKTAHPSEPYVSENLPHSDGHRPIVRSRLTTPSTREVVAEEGRVLKDPEAPPAPNFANAEAGYGREESRSKEGLPTDVKSAIIASSCLLGIALLIFLSIFAAFRYRQWRRRRGLSPYFCETWLETAEGGKKRKGPKIVKKGRSRESGWGDTIDSAQARLWRTLRRGRCRFYDREREQI